LADKSKPVVETATAAPGEARSVSPPPPPPPPAPPAPKLAKASESGDPQVQALLADRSAAQAAGDEALLDTINAHLAGLGFE
jgi:hypothetical protein